MNDDQQSKSQKRRILKDYVECNSPNINDQWCAATSRSKNSIKFQKFAKFLNLLIIKSWVTARCTTRFLKIQFFNLKIWEFFMSHPRTCCSQHNCKLKKRPRPNWESQKHQNCFVGNFFILKWVEKLDNVSGST